MTITFTTLDDCLRDDTCFKRIIIRDNSPPTLNCDVVTDLTIQTSEVGDPLLVDNWIASLYPADADQCGRPLVNETDFDRDLIEFACTDLPPIPVAFSSVDDCDNRADCIKNIMVVSDYTSQENCPTDFTVDCGDDNLLLNLVAWLGSATITDNAGSNIIMDTDANINDPNLFDCDTATDVMFTGSDICGEGYVCNSRIITMDDVVPTITNCPPDQTIENDPNLDLNDQIDAWLNLFDGTDNCELVTFTDSFDPTSIQNCDQSYTEVVVFTVTDACSNSNSCMATLTINSDLKPKIDCLPELVIECGDDDYLNQIDTWINETNAFDFAGTDLNDRLINSYIPGSFDNIDCDTVITIMFNVEDDCTFTDMCEGTIRIVDTTSPSIECPLTDLTISTSSTTALDEINAWLASVVYDDNCEVVNIEEQYTIDLDNLCAAPARTDVTFIATDACLLSNQCTMSININSSAPSIACPAQIELSCDEADILAAIESELLNITALDNNNNNVGFTSDLDALVIDDGCLFESTVTFISNEDACGATTTCVTQIRIVDNTPPMIDCPPGLTLSGGDPNLRLRAFEFVEAISVSDCNYDSFASDLDTSLLEFSCESEVLYPVNFTAVDNCGFSSPCNFTIVVTNETELTLSCPPNDLIVECGLDNEQIIFDWLKTATASDNSGLSIPVGDNYDPGNHNNLGDCDSVVPVTFTMIDDCSNTSQDCIKNIIVDDTLEPVVTCPSDTSFTQGTASFDLDIQNWLSEYSAMDNCGDVNVEDNYVPINQLNNCEPSVDLPILFTGTDPCNIIGTCTAILTIRSDKQPIINCPGDIVVECNDPDNLSLLDDLANGVTGADSEGNALIPQFDFTANTVNTLSCGESLDVIFTVTDDCDIVEDCTWVISVEDNIAPELSCPLDININSSEDDLSATILNWAESYTASDNCGNVSVVYDDINALDFCEGPASTLVNFVATDECDQSSNCSATIFLNTSDPSIDCPNDLSLECGDPNNNQNIDDWTLLFTAVDNNNVSISPDNNFTGLSALIDCESSLTPISFTVTDNCGKTAECVRNISIDDSLAPEITCPPNQEFDISSPSFQNEVNTWLNSVAAEDLCNVAIPDNNFSIDLNTVICGDGDPVTFTAVDECNNLSECVTNISFIKDQNISIGCPEPVTIVCGDSQTMTNLEIFLADYEINESDSASVTTSFDVDNFNENCTSNYIQDVTFTVQDICSNTNSCESSIEFIPAARYYIPNTFSPNGEGDRIFMVFGNEAIDSVVEMSIYNRWGNLVYSAENFPPNDESYGWNGTWGNNSKKQADTYVYKIIIRDINGDEFIEVGNLTVIP